MYIIYKNQRSIHWIPRSLGPWVTKKVCVMKPLPTHTHTHTYIYRERERDREIAWSFWGRVPFFRSPYARALSHCQRSFAYVCMHVMSPDRFMNHLKTHACASDFPWARHVSNHLMRNLPACLPRKRQRIMGCALFVNSCDLQIKSDSKPKHEMYCRQWLSSRGETLSNIHLLLTQKVTLHH